MHAVIGASRKYKLYGMTDLPVAITGMQFPLETQYSTKSFFVAQQIG